MVGRLRRVLLVAALALMGTGCIPVSVTPEGELERGRPLMQGVLETVDTALNRMDDQFTAHLRSVAEAGPPGSPGDRTAYIFFRDLIFAFLAFVVISTALRDYILAGESERMIIAIFRVGLVWVIMVTLAQILEAVYNAQVALSNAVQVAFLGETSDGLWGFYAETQGILSESISWRAWDEDSYLREEDGEQQSLFERISSQIGRVVFVWNQFWSLFFLDLANNLILLILKVLVIVIVAAGIVVRMYAIVVFFLAASLGPMLFPFILWRPLDFLATGWIRSVGSMWLYGVVATVVICFITIGFRIIATIPAGAEDPGDIGSLGLVSLFMYILYLAFAGALIMRVGEISNGIISGMGVGGDAGFGMLRQGGSLATRFLRGGR